MHTNLLDGIEGKGDSERERATEMEPKSSRERFDVIVAKMAGTDFDPAEVSKLIATQIGLLTKEIMSCSFAAEDAHIVKGLETQVKALRQLSAQLEDVDKWRVKEDVLNLNGEKFRYVLKRITGLFREAMKKGGLDDGTIKSIWLTFTDLLTEHDSDIRREVEKIGSKKTA